VADRRPTEPHPLYVWMYGFLPGRVRPGHIAGPIGLLAAVVLAACSTTASIPMTARGAVDKGAASSAAPSHLTSATSQAVPAATGNSGAVGSSAPVRPCLVQSDVAGSSCDPCRPAKLGPLAPESVLSCSPVPPNPPVPPSASAHISMCPWSSGSVSGPQLRGSAAVCGTGFAAYEVVAITVTGQQGSTSWMVIAGLRGTFAAALVPSACRVAPAQLVARGNKGHVSNALALSAAMCRPRM
jgi:hypothetical protein